MCGYCIESAYFAGIESDSVEPIVERPLQYLHLQETPDWFAYYLEYQNDFGMMADVIALCRAWDDIYFRSDRDVLFGLQRIMGRDRLASLAKYLRLSAPSPDWEWMIPTEPEIRLDPDIKAAARVLADYRDAYLDWNNPAKPRRKEVRKPQEVIEGEMFWVYVSLVLSDRFDTVMNEVCEIALSLPLKTPDFTGMDLWLQRRAFSAAIRRHGSAFFYTHRKKARDEIVSSAHIALRAQADYSADIARKILLEGAGSS